MAERGFFRRPQYPEQNNPLGRGGFRLGITTHDRPSTPTRESPPLPTKETQESSPKLQRPLTEAEVFGVFDRFAPPPTEEQIRNSNSGEYAGSTRTVERVGGNGWVKKGLAGAAVGAIGGYVAYHESPAFHRLVDSYFLSHLRDGSATEASEIPTTESSPVKTKEVNTDELYDKNADKQTVKAGRNARPVSEEEALVLAKENPPQLKEGEFPTFPMVFIGKLKDGEEATIDTHYVDQAYNPIEQKFDRLNTGRYITFKEAGTELGFSFEEYEVFQVDPFIYKDQPYFSGVVVRVYDSNGVPHVFYLNAPEDKRHLAPTEIVKNAPTVGKNGKITGKYYEEIKDRKGIVVNGPETIITTTKDNAKVRIGAAAMLEQYPKGLVEKIIFIDQDGQMIFPEPTKEKLSSQ